VSARIVQAGYDALAPRFGEWSARVDGDPWATFVDDLAARLRPGARVLDLGCGNGEKLARLAGRGLELTGVDFSVEQLRLAEAAVPEATFVQADFTELEREPASFDAVVALYSVTHVPRERHGELFQRIRGWLQPGGLFLASLSHAGGPDWTGEWLGVEMFFSGFDADTNRRLVREAALELLRDEPVCMQEPEGEVAFLWVLARRPA
jgi:cyclopropane fatty-acyl-phospholipid synthase-like methyltransferase